MNWISWLDATSTGQHELEIGLRLLLAAVLGAVIGFEREAPERPAGLRTHMLVAVAACVFTILTFEIHALMEQRGDPIRIISSVTAGVAFLAAGTIVRADGGQVRGLTTGAAMWMAGSLGVAAGAGFYVVAVLATIVTFAVLRGMYWLEAMATPGHAARKHPDDSEAATSRAAAPSPSKGGRDGHGSAADREARGGDANSRGSLASPQR